MPPKQAIMMKKKRTGILGKKKRIYAETCTQNFEDTNNTNPPDFQQKIIDGASQSIRPQQSTPSIYRRNVVPLTAIIDDDTPIFNNTSPTVDGLDGDTHSVENIINLEVPAEGKSVQEMVNEALKRVPNYDVLINSGGIVWQPHLQRTKLCDMNDSELEPKYVERREQLKELVATVIRPKIVQGKTLSGKEFASFLEQILKALNKGDIPSTDSIVEVFNKVILERCMKLYNQRMDKLHLPVPESRLEQAHDEVKIEARKLFDQQHFGCHHAKQSIIRLYQI